MITVKAKAKLGSSHREYLESIGKKPEDYKLDYVRVALTGEEKTVKTFLDAVGAAFDNVVNNLAKATVDVGIISKTKGAIVGAVKEALTSAEAQNAVVRALAKVPEMPETVATAEGKDF